MSDETKELQWARVCGYENHYLVSNTGVVLSIKSKKPLKQNPNSNGYPTISLYSFGKMNTTTVHSIVARAFVHKPKQIERLVVDHIDGNKSNNHYSNLEFVTQKENVHRAIRSGVHKPRIKQKPVQQIDMDGNFVHVFDSASEAARLTGFSQVGISRCARGERNKHKGYNWIYVNTIQPNPYK